MVHVMYLIHVCYEAHISYNFRRANYIYVYELHRYHVSDTSHKPLKSTTSTYYIIYFYKLYKIDSMDISWFV